MALLKAPDEFWPVTFAKKRDPRLGRLGRSAAGVLVILVLHIGSHLGFYVQLFDAAWPAAEERVGQMSEVQRPHRRPRDRAVLAALFDFTPASYELDR